MGKHVGRLVVAAAIAVCALFAGAGTANAAENPSWKDNAELKAVAEYAAGMNNIPLSQFMGDAGRYAGEIKNNSEFKFSDRLVTYTYRLPAKTSTTIDVRNESTDCDSMSFLISVHQDGAPAGQADTLAPYWTLDKSYNKYSWKDGNRSQRPVDWAKAAGKWTPTDHDDAWGRAQYLLAMPQWGGGCSTIAKYSRGTSATVSNNSDEEHALSVTLSGGVADFTGGDSSLRVKFTDRSSAVVQPSTDFVDVDSSTSHASDIEWLASTGITTGFDDGTFKPTANVQRQDMAAFLRRLAKSNNVSDAATWKPSVADWSKFKDVNQSSPHAEDVLWLAHAGITTGYGDGTFQGGATVQRQDMAAFLRRLAKLAGKDGQVTGSKQFTDVNEKTPHAEDVAWLGASKISQGYPDGSFGVGQGVQRADMAAFLHRLDDILA